jgi:hypothetical protein
MATSAILISSICRFELSSLIDAKRLDLNLAF